MQLPISHIAGRHCASTALANLARFHGLNLSEAMCFGLGEGLGMYYLTMPGLEPARSIAVRALDYEQQFFTHLGLPFRWDQHDDPQAAEAALLEALDRGRLALVQTDIFYLPYYQSKTHFAGHLITVWGYDRAEQVFLVTDTERAQVYRVPFAAMRQARYCPTPPFIMKGNLIAPPELHLIADLRQAIRNAMVGNSARLLAEDLPFQGMAALRLWLEDLPKWATLADWKWTARLAYQTIQKRGTGGGGFRLMYAEFLREATPLLPAIEELGLASAMQALGKAWDDLALALRELSEKAQPELAGVERALKHLGPLEEAYHRRVAAWGQA